MISSTCTHTKKARKKLDVSNKIHHYKSEGQSRTDEDGEESWWEMTMGKNYFIITTQKLFIGGRPSLSFFSFLLFLHF